MKKFQYRFYSFLIIEFLASCGSDNKITVIESNDGKVKIELTADAGTNQSIFLPQNSVTLSGIGTDADGTITSYTWTKVSGPTGSSLGSPNSASTTATFTTAGQYVLRLTVSNNVGAFASDDITIGVLNNPLVPPITYTYSPKGLIDIVINNSTFGAVLKAGDSVIIPPRSSGGWRSMTYQGINSGAPGSYVVVYWKPGAYISTGVGSQLQLNYLDSCNGLKVVGVNMDGVADVFWRLRVGYSSWIWIDSASVVGSLGIPNGYSSTFRDFNNDTSNMFHHWKLSNSIIDSLYADGADGNAFGTGKIQANGFWRDVEIYNNRFSRYKNRPGFASRFLQLDNCYNCYVYNNTFDNLGMTPANGAHTSAIEFSAGKVDVYNNTFGPEIFGNDIRGKWSELKNFPTYKGRGRIYNNITFWKRKYSHVEAQGLGGSTITALGTWIDGRTSPDIWNITAYKLAVGDPINTSYNTGIYDSYMTDSVFVKNCVIVSIRDATWGVNKMAIITEANGKIRYYDTASNRMIQFFANAGLSDTIKWIPKPGGPLYNTGVPTPAWLTIDKYGKNRSSQGGVDIGAVEYTLPIQK